MNDLEEAYNILRLKPGSSWEQVVAQHKLLSAMWNPERFAKESEDKLAQREFDKINWAKSFLENNEDLILRIENKGVYRIDLNAEIQETTLGENRDSIYFPKTQSTVIGERLLYAQGATFINRWRATQGAERLLELMNPVQQFFFTA
jgi:hypothetical protein